MGDFHVVAEFEENLRAFMRSGGLEPRFRTRDQRPSMDLEPPRPHQNSTYRQETEALLEHMKEVELKSAMMSERYEVVKKMARQERLLGYFALAAIVTATMSAVSALLSRPEVSSRIIDLLRGAN
jgi:hypothetical protein